jgi:hypothetical protein
MAIGNTTQYGSRTALDQKFAPGFEDAVYRNNQLLGMTVNGSPVFPESSIAPYGADYRWTLNTAGNSAEIYTEGQAAGTPGAQTYTNLTATPVYFWAWVRLSGHVRDAIRNGGSKPGLNPAAAEFLGTFGDIADLMNTTFMGSTYGVTQIVDSANTVFGVDQSSVAVHAASETALGGALTQAALTNISEASRDNDKGGNWRLALCGHNQITNYTNLAGAAGASNNSVRFDMSTVGGGRMDLGPDPSQAEFQGRPLIGIGDFDDNTIVGLDTRMTRFGPNWALKTARYFETREHNKAGDDDVYQLSTARALVCHVVKYNWKLGTVTA